MCYAVVVAAHAVRLLTAIAFASPCTDGRYAKYQGQAGRVVGIPPGEAWRVALRAAVAAGASQASSRRWQGLGMHASAWQQLWMHTRQTQPFSLCTHVGALG